MGNSPLHVMFPRLYSISNQKEATVGDIGLKSDGIVSSNLTWRRCPFNWEQDLITILTGVIASARSGDEEDVWWW